jgi:hypothetical protein
MIDRLLAPSERSNCPASPVALPWEIMKRSFVLPTLGSTLGLLACAGSTAQPEEPAHETPRLGGVREVQSFEAEVQVAGDADDEAESSETLEDSVSEAEEPSAPSASPEPPAVRPARSLAQLLFAPKISFAINWPASAPKEAIEKRCSAQAGEDMDAFAKCRSDARKEFVADALLFKVEQGNHYWYVYRRDRDTLFDVSKSQVAIAGEDDRTLTLRMVGKGTGARPLFIGAQEAPLTLPDESSLIIEDPRFGRLVYEAKIGIMGP